MAKKNLTPEELQAKQAKKAEKSKVFFGTFTKALAVFLAIVMAWALVSISFTAPSVGTGGSGVASSNGGTASSGGAANTDEDILGGGDEDLLGTDDDVTPGDGETPDDGETPGNSEDSDGDQPAAMTKADIAKLLNDVTAKSVKGNYKWTRKCWYTTALDVGSATDTLNDIIHRVDSNADLNSVVGGFLGITGKETDPAWEGDVKGGKLPEEGKMKEEKYLLKAFALTEADIMGTKVSGNTYTIQLNAVKSPQKDNKNALNHVTNDFITMDEVAKGVSDGLGALGNLVTIQSLDVDFTAILVSAVVENNALKSVKISYTMTVNALKLRATVVPITGTGAGKMECTYTF